MCLRSTKSKLKISLKKKNIVRSEHGGKYHEKYDESSQLMGPCKLFTRVWNFSPVHNAWHARTLWYAKITSIIT